MTAMARQGAARGLRCPRVDYPLILVALSLAALGWVMVASASVTIADRELGRPFHYALRQALYLVAALGLGAAVARVRLVVWERAGLALLGLALALLVLVLVPGIGREVNGALRWIALGPVNVQVSEPAKLLVLMYLAGYLVRRGEEVRAEARGFLKPLAVLSLSGALLLLQPDFGAAAVLLATALVMMFLAGVRWWQFGGLLATTVLALGVLAVSAPYRMARLTAFLNPWADPFNSGFQLTQSLIAFGRGEWLGVGLGGGVQKLFYLPEAHTDFVFAVLGEELGLLGVLVVIALYAFVVWRAFAIGGVALRVGLPFAAYLAYGIGAWLGLQSFVNMGVTMGLLPTKGLTLPLFSYGGSSLLVTVAALALLVRVDYESRGAPDHPACAGGRRR